MAQYCNFASPEFHFCCCVSDQCPTMSVRELVRNKSPVQRSNVQRPTLNTHNQHSIESMKRQNRRLTSEREECTSTAKKRKQDTAYDKPIGENDNEIDKTEDETEARGIFECWKLHS